MMKALYCEACKEVGVRYFYFAIVRSGLLTFKSILYSAFGWLEYQVVLVDKRDDLPIHLLASVAQW